MSKTSKRTEPMPACQVCGKPVRTPINATCSVACKGLLSRGPTAPRVTGKCKFCLKEFSVLAARGAVFCSKECAVGNRKRETEARRRRNCVVCGDEFTPGRYVRRAGWSTMSTAKTCSPACLAEREKTIKLGIKAVGRGAATEDYHRALHAVLKSPSGKSYEVHNLCKFVRDNPDLFHPDDTNWKPKNRTGTSRECRASSGLRNVIHGRLRSWKDWILKLDIKSGYRPKD